MKALGMIEVYSFTTAFAAADVAAKAADVKVIAFDRNRPISPDVPAPLVMEVKIEGNVSAVKAAIDAATAYAKSEGKFIVSHIIANPDKDTEKMAYLLDINRDKYNKKLPKNMMGVEAGKTTGETIGLVEIEGLVAAIEGLDNMVKTADVRLVHTEKRLGGRLVTLIVAGSVSSVKASVESGAKAATALGKVFGQVVIPSPSAEVIKFLDME